MEKKFILILLVLFIMNCSCLYISLCKKNKEKMTNTSNNITAIKKVVNEVYQADIQAIRNLSVIAKKLQSGGKNGTLTIPGNVRIEGGLKVGGTANISKNLKVGKNSDFGTKSGKKLRISSDLFNGSSTRLEFYNGTSRVNYIDPKLNADINTFGGINTRTVTSSGNISGGTLIARKNNSIIGHSNGQNYLKGVVNMNSNLIVNNNLTVNGRTNNKYVRYIQIGNKYGLRNKIAYDTWTIAQVDVFDINGRNVSLRKPVRKLKGTVYRNYIKPSYLVNGLGRASDNWRVQYTATDRSNREEQLLEIDLRGNYQISHIQVWNRWNNSVAKRMNGTHVELFNSKRKSIYLEHGGCFGAWSGLIWNINLNKSH